MVRVWCTFLSHTLDEVSLDECMKTPLPFPPKSSIFWNKQDYSYEDAVSVYEKEGDPFFLMKSSDLPTDEITGDPPQSSMFWEGCTHKKETIPSSVVEKKAPSQHFAQKEEIAEEEALRFVVVRYAIDQVENENVKPFGLPLDWKGKGAAKLIKAGYTLRQLRDGWLYVYDAAKKTLDEYHIKGTELTYYKLSEEEDSNSAERGTPQPSTRYLTYATGSQLSISFSPHRWTWALFLTFLADPSCHTKYMQYIDLKKDSVSLHSANIAQLSEVGDIEKTAVEDDRFIDSGVLTQAPKTELEGTEEGPLEIKPVAAISDFIFSPSVHQPVMFVAINDSLGEIKDMALHFAAVATPYRLFEETFANQWTLMQTAMQLCMFGDTENIAFPFSVKTEQEKLKFYIAMGEYYEALNQGDIIENNNNNMGATAEALYKEKIDSYHTTQKKLSDSIWKEYGIKPDSFNKYKQWENAKNWRKHLRWKDMLEEMHKLSATKEALLKNVSNIKGDFIQVLGSLSSYHIEHLFDLCCEKMQTELCELHVMMAESFSLVMQEDDLKWAQNQWENPTCMLSLFTAGFSRRVFNQFTLILPEYKEEENSHLENAGTGNNTITAYAKLNDFFSNESIMESKIFKALSGSFFKLDKIMNASIKVTQKMGVTLVARSSMALFGTITNKKTQLAVYWRLAIAERIALNSPVMLNENYIKELDEYRGKLVNAITEIKKADDVINSNASDSNEKMKKAHAKKKKAKKILSANRINIPSRILFPDDIKNARSKSIENILDGKMNKAGDVFEGIGGSGFLPFIFYFISFLDAINTISQTGLMSNDDALNVQQQLFYTAAAWSGIRASKAWANVKTDPRLISVSQRALKTLIISNENFKDINLKGLKTFNKLLALTAGLGMVASLIEGVRSFEKIDEAYGNEKNLHKANTFALAGLAFTSGFQLLAITGRFSLGFLAGGPISGIILLFTMAYLLINIGLLNEKKDAYQKWLAKLPWGTNLGHIKWSLNSDLEFRHKENNELIEKALFELQGIVWQPRVQHFVLKTPYGYLDQEITGLDVRIEIPNQAIYHSIKIKTSTQATKEQLTSGVWHENVGLDTFDESKVNKEHKKESRIYQIQLPVEKTTSSYPINQNNIQYLSLSIEYVLEDGNTTHSYFFRKTMNSSGNYINIEEKQTQMKFTDITGEILRES